MSEACRTATCTHGAMLASLSEVVESFKTIMPLSAMAKSAGVMPKSYESAESLSNSKEMSNSPPSPKSVPNFGSITPFLQPLDFKKPAMSLGEVIISARFFTKFLSNTVRAPPSPIAAYDTVSESSKSGSLLFKRDFSAFFILSKKARLSIFLKPFSKFSAPKFWERSRFQPPAERPDLHKPQRKQISKLV